MTSFLATNSIPAGPTPQSERSIPNTEVSTTLRFPAISGQDPLDSVHVCQPDNGDRRLLPLEGHEVCRHHLLKTGSARSWKQVQVVPPTNNRNTPIFTNSIPLPGSLS